MERGLRAFRMKVVRGPPCLGETDTDATARPLCGADAAPSPSQAEKPMTSASPATRDPAVRPRAALKATTRKYNVPPDVPRSIATARTSRSSRGPPLLCALGSVAVAPGRVEEWERRVPRRLTPSQLSPVGF